MAWERAAAEDRVVADVVLNKPLMDSYTYLVPEPPAGRRDARPPGPGAVRAGEVRRQVRDRVRRRRPPGRRLRRRTRGEAGQTEVRRPRAGRGAAGRREDAGAVAAGSRSIICAAGGRCSVVGRAGRGEAERRQPRTRLLPPHRRGPGRAGGGQPDQKAAGRDGRPHRGRGAGPGGLRRGQGGLRRRGGHEPEAQGVRGGRQAADGRDGPGRIGAGGLDRRDRHRRADRGAGHDPGGAAGAAARDVPACTG